MEETVFMQKWKMQVKHKTAVMFWRRFMTRGPMNRHFPHEGLTRGRTCDQTAQQNGMSILQK